MKLVIEVPYQVVDMVCNTGTYGYYRFISTKAIKKGIPLDKVIEDIKAEIRKEMIESGKSNVKEYGVDDYYADKCEQCFLAGVYRCLEIIDKHFEGETE